MWPWEHAIVGYLVYSLFCHAIYRDSPGGLEAFAVVFASVLPDLVDKLLAWEFGVVAGGYAVGHSIFAAVPLAIAVGLAARASGRPRAGLAFGIGHLLHLPADVVDAYAREGVFIPELMLWPAVVIEDPGADQGFVGQFLRFFARYQRELFAGDLPTYLRIQIGLALFALAVWLYDGAPVLRDLLRGCRRLVLGPDRSLEESTDRR